MSSKNTQALYALAETAINTVTAGSAVTLTTGAVTAAVSLWFAQSTTTAPASGTRLILQGDDQTSGNSTWVDLITFVTGTTAAESEAVSGTEAAGSTVIEVASTANLGTRTEDIFFKNSTLGNSEWAKLVSIVSNTSITLLDALTNAQTSSTIYDQAANYILNVPVDGLKRLRLIVDNNYQATGPTVAVKASVTDYVP